MNTFIDKVKGAFRGEKTRAGMFRGTAIDLTLSILGFPVPLGTVSSQVLLSFEKDKDWENACACIQEGKLMQAKEMFENIGKKYGGYDKVYEKLLEIHDQLQENENVIIARNLAIYLIGSKDSGIKNRAIEFYKRNTNKLIERGFTKIIVPGKRQCIYIGENIDSIGGANSMNNSNQTTIWFFDIDNLPPDLSFQNVYPRPGLYVQHPFSPNKYYPRENVEKEWFKEKVDEFLYLMQCLGATKTRYEFQSGKNVVQDKTIEAGAETAVKTQADDIGIGVGIEADPRLKIIDKKVGIINDQEFVELLYSPVEKIYVPDNLLWYDSEQKWDTIVRGRKHRSSGQVDIAVSSKGTNMISKEIDAKVKSSFEYFVKVKGNFDFNEQKVFTESEETAWSFHVDFAPLDENLVPIGAPSQNLKAPILPDVSSQTNMDKKKNLVIWILGGVAVALAAGLIIALL